MELGGWDEGLLREIVTTEGFNALGTGLQLEVPDMSALLDRSGSTRFRLRRSLEPPSKGSRARRSRSASSRCPSRMRSSRALVTRGRTVRESTGVLTGSGSHLLGL